MSIDTLVAIKALLVVAAVFGWGFWQLRQLKNDTSDDDRRSKGDDRA